MKQIRRVIRELITPVVKSHRVPNNVMGSSGPITRQMIEFTGTESAEMMDVVRLNGDAELIIKFSTTETSGLLTLVAFNTAYGVRLDLTLGKISFYNGTAGFTYTLVNETINDGVQHTIKYTMSGGQATMDLDGINKKPSQTLELFAGLDFRWIAISNAANNLFIGTALDVQFKDIDNPAESHNNNQHHQFDSGHIAYEVAAEGSVSTELMLNPSFETDLSNWTTNPTHVQWLAGAMNKFGTGTNVDSYQKLNATIALGDVLVVEANASAITLTPVLFEDSSYIAYSKLIYAEGITNQSGLAKVNVGFNRAIFRAKSSLAQYGIQANNATFTVEDYGVKKLVKGLVFDGVTSANWNEYTYNGVTGCWDHATLDTICDMDNAVPYLQYFNDVTPRYGVDTNVPSIPTDGGQVMLAENTQLAGDINKYTKYNPIQTQSGALDKVRQIQALVPIKSMRQFNLEYLDYDVGGCSQAKGIPFSSTTAGTGDGTCGVFAGHWLYEPFAQSTGAINDTDVTITVDDVSTFSVNSYIVIYDDEVGPATDFTNAEHAKITGIAGNVLTIARGYNSTAVSHGSSSRVAQHVEGQAGNRKNWMYNLSSACPDDGNGVRYTEYVATWLNTNYNHDDTDTAIAVTIYGIAFDIDFRYSFASKNADVDNNGSPDYGIFAGVNKWADGVNELYTLVKAQTNLTSFFVYGGISDSAGHEGYNHGTQMEGAFVASTNYHEGVPDWDDMNMLIAEWFLRHRESYGPQMNYVLSKTPSAIHPYNTKYPAGAPGAVNSSFRLQYAYTLLMNSPYAQQNNTHSLDPWYDEYAVDVVSASPTYGQAIPIATAGQPETAVIAAKGWLGQPLAEYTRVYDAYDFEESDDLYVIAGSNGTLDDNITGWTVGNNCTIHHDTDTSMAGAGSIRGSNQVTLNSNQWGTRFKGPQVTLVSGTRYTMVWAMKADHVRSMKVYIGGAEQSYTISDEWQWYVFTFDATTTGLNNVQFTYGIEDTQLWVDEVKFFEGDINVFRRDFEHGSVFANGTDNPVTITFETGETFDKIDGTQDATINDGSKGITSVTIPARDGIILVKPDV